MGFNITSDSQRLKPQPPSNVNSVPRFPFKPLTTDQIQKCLDDNKSLILAILESQSLGKLSESAQFQEILQQNLTYLAAMADAQPLQGSATASQVVASSVPPQGKQMQQTQASTLKQQQSDPVQELPFQFNAPQSQDQPQQLLQFQHQQQFQSQLGFGSAANSGMHQIMRPGLSSSGRMDIRGNMQPSSSHGGGQPGHGGGDMS